MARSQALFRPPGIPVENPVCRIIESYVGKPVGEPSAARSRCLIGGIRPSHEKR